MVRRRPLGVLGLVLASVLLACTGSHEDVGDSAADITATFDKDNLVSDEELRDGKTITAAQIDAFLEKNPWGNKSVLASHREDGKTVGELLVTVCAKYDVNPLELLVRLQMEQGLVNKSSASDHLLDLAFGCGCPHSPLCGPQYMGFGNQADCAAGTLGRSIDRAKTKTGTASGWKVGVGKTTEDKILVTPANAATAALYTYTPWIGEAGGGKAGVGGASLHHDIWWKFAQAMGYGAEGSPEQSGGSGMSPPPSAGSSGSSGSAGSSGSSGESTSGSSGESSSGSSGNDESSSGSPSSSGSSGSSGASSSGSSGIDGSSSGTSGTSGSSGTSGIGSSSGSTSGGTSGIDGSSSGTSGSSGAGTSSGGTSGIDGSSSGSSTSGSSGSSGIGSSSGGTSGFDGSSSGTSGTSGSSGFGSSSGSSGSSGIYGSSSGSPAGSSSGSSGSSGTSTNTPPHKTDPGGTDSNGVEPADDQILQNGNVTPTDNTPPPLPDSAKKNKPTPPPEVASSGCSSTASSHSTGSSPLALGLALAIIAARRRRRVTADR